MSISSAFRGALLLAVLAVAGCDTGESENVVARAGNETLTVDEAATLMMGRENIPNTAQVVRAVAELWTDYSLLAQEMQEDSTFQSVDFSSVVDAQMDQALIMAFRDREVQVDTTFTEEELVSEYGRLGSNTQLRARHILLSFPAGATEAQRDSVATLADELRQRAEEGEDFGDLAEQYSDDPGSAGRGGDLGTFGRGSMVPAFEEAAFALEEGEISEPVESPYGVHVIQLQERIQPPLEEVREEFVSQLRQRRVFEAESTFVADVGGEASPEVQEDALDVVRQLASDPATTLSSRARERPLVTLEDGALTVADFQQFIRTRPNQERAQIEQGTEQQLRGLLQNLAQRKALVDAARTAEVEVPAGVRDSLRAQVREALQTGVTALGLREIPADDDEAVEQQVLDVLGATLQGQRGVHPLGALSFVLREEREARIYDAALPRVVARVEEAEAGDSATAGSEPPGGRPPVSQPPQGQPPGGGNP